MTDQEFPMIDPHDGREFELMDAGRKSVAFFHKDIPPSFDDYKTREGYGAIEWDAEFEGMDGQIHVVPCRILYRTGSEASAERLKEILTNYERGFDIYLEREIGQILGYPPEAVEYYIMGVLSRN